MNNKYKKLLSFVFVFLLSFVGMNKVEAASYYAPGTLPSTIRLKNDSDSGEIVVGTVTQRAVNNAYSGNKFVAVPNPYAGQTATTYTHPSTDGINFICLEKGVVANWGGTYNKSSRITGELPKLIAFGINKGWADRHLQAMVWQYLGQVDLNANYYWHYQRYLDEKAKNPNSPLFKGVTAYKYIAPSYGVEFQELIGYEYKKPIEKVLLRIEKYEELSMKNNVKAQNAAPKLYDLNGAVYGVYNSESDARANRNPIKTTTLKYDSGNRTYVSGQVSVNANKTYYVKEISSPKGYAKNPSVYTVHVGERNAIVKVKDKPLTDPIRIMVNKKSDRRKPLAGAEFEVSYFNEIISESQARNTRPTRTWKFKTNEKGIITLSDSYKIGGDPLYKKSDGTPTGLKGTYLIRETKAPKGYMLDTKQEVRHITGDQNFSGVAKFENNPVNATNTQQVGKISIAKIDKDTKVALKGVKFDIKLTHAIGETDIAPGTIVDTLTMGGKEESKELPLGAYEIVERRDSLVDRGYQIMQDKLRVMINPSDDASKWADYRATGEENNNNIVKVRAGNNSKKEWTLFLTLDNTPQKGVLRLIKEAPMLTGTTTEDKFGYKVSKPKIEKGRLAGTKWQLIADEDIISKDGVTPFYKKGQVVETLTTTTTSTTSKEHPLGKYILKEIDSPKQYTVDLNSYDVTFNVQNPEVRIHSITTTRQNERKEIPFTFTKEFEGSKYFTRDPEAIFGLYLAEDYKENGVTIRKDTLLDAVKIKAVDSENKTTNNLEEQKSFEIKEFRTKQVDDTTKPIYEGTTTWEITVVDRDKKETNKIFTTEDDANAFIAEEKEKGSDIKEIKNPTRKLVGYEKKDQRDLIKTHTVNTVEKKDELENAFKKANIDYEIKEIPYQGKADEGKTITRIASGKFENMPIDGKFYIKEIAKDDNYVFSDTKYTDVDFAKSNDKIHDKDLGKFTNRLIRVKVNAVKFEEGSKEDGGAIPVEGAVYELIAVDDKKGETLVGTYATDSLGQISIENLEPGHYYLKETSSPSGYFLNEDKIEFDIDGKKTKDGGSLKIETIDEKIPEIGTTATDNETGKKRINPTENIEIKDKVRYKDLVIGKTYTIKGKLMFKDTEKPVLVEGKEVTAEKTFIPKQRNGEEELIFSVPGEILRGKETVVFEKLYREKREVTSHEDIFDEGQTTTTVNPEIGTRLADITANDKLLNPISIVKLEDKVFFKDLVVGEEYELTMNLWNKKTNDFLRDDQGRKVTVTKKFIPKVENGTVGVSVTLDLSKFRNVDITAFEELTYKGQLMATHKDKEDKDQTIRVFDPKIKTKFATIDGKKIAEEDLYEVTLVDTVKYENLVPNKVYKMHLTVMDKSTKDKLVVNGKTVETELIFRTPEKSNQENGGVSGEVKISAKTNLSMHRGKDIVAFETLSYTNENVKNEIIARHEDFDDKDQTISIAKFSLPITGSTKLNNIITVGIGLSAISLIAFVSMKKYRSVLND